MNNKKELMIKTIGNDDNKLIKDSNLKEKLIGKEIKGKERKLEGIERIKDTIKRLIFMNVPCEWYGLFEPYN